MIKISKRLKAIADLVPDNCTICDVGCDHALLDIYLYQTKKNIKLIDGNLLADLLVKYEVGVAAAQTFKLYKLDTEYFNF